MEEIGTFIIVVLILAIFLLLFWIRKQNQYIQAIKDISDGKSRQIESLDEFIVNLLEDIPPTNDKVN